VPSSAPNFTKRRSVCHIAWQPRNRAPALRQPNPSIPILEFPKNLLTYQYLYDNVPRAVIDAHSHMHLRSGSSFRPPDAPHPASPTASPQISNRYWKLLEIPVTPTKHLPGPVSNRNKNRGIACRAGCSPTTSKIRPTPETPAGPPIQRRLPVEAGSRLSRSGRLAFAHYRPFNRAGLRLTHAQSAPTGSPLQTRGPRSVHALIRFVARKRTACAAGYSTPLRHASPHISNRHWKRLEISVTHTKQTPDPFLIDTENALFSRRFHAPPCVEVSRGGGRRWG
jgi:hypothetical protein